MKRPPNAYTCRHGGGVLRQRVQRGVHHLVVADVAVALARQVQHVGVHVEEGQDHAARLVQRVRGDGFVEVAEIPHSPLTLRCAIEARGDDTRRFAQPRHLRRLRAVVGTPLADYAILARIEDAIHLVLRRDAEQGAAVVPVQILGKRLAIAAHDLVTQLAVPHLGRAVATPNPDTTDTTQRQTRR